MLAAYIQMMQAHGIIMLLLIFLLHNTGALAAKSAEQK
jgi:hypothetical protein